MNPYYFIIDNGKMEQMNPEQLIQAILKDDQEEAIHIIGELTDEQLVLQSENSYILQHTGERDDNGNLIQEMTETLPAGEGWTPLHFACFKGKKDVVQILLQRIQRGDRFIKSKHGMTPLDLVKTEEIKAMFEPQVKAAF